MNVRCSGTIYRPIPGLLMDGAIGNRRRVAGVMRWRKSQTYNPVARRWITTIDEVIKIDSFVEIGERFHPVLRVE